MKSQQKNRPRSRRYPIPLARAADDLGVSYNHLWLVMNDHRRSARLKERYAGLVRNLRETA